MRVCVLGLGEVGLPTAKYVANKGIEVFGYDIKRDAVERAKKQGIKAFVDWRKIPVSDVYIICVYAGLKHDEPDFSSIFDVCTKISQRNLIPSSETCLVSIESTIVPGLSRKVFRELFKESVKLVHVPHRFWADDPTQHGVKQPRVIGAVDDDSLKYGWNFYNEILGIPLHRVRSIETAEMTKVTENAYRYTQIAFAEELRMVCGEIGIDFNEVRAACNSKWNIEIPEARDGIGGHCLPKDAQYFASLAHKAQLMHCALLVDRIYRKWLRKTSTGSKTVTSSSKRRLKISRTS